MNHRRLLRCPWRRWRAEAVGYLDIGAPVLRTFASRDGLHEELEEPPAGLERILGVLLDLGYPLP
jgi:hypothetical protein